MSWAAGDFTADKIAAVRPHVDPHIRRTPLLESARLSERAGVPVHLKCENLQVTGAFKIRGALAALSQLSPPERERGVITSSTGNHGAALARAAGLMRVPCTVAIPPDTPEVKRRNIAAQGARWVESPRKGYDATQAWTLERTAQSGETFVSGFEDPWVAAGNGGTTGLEILEELPDAAEIITPVGGGGLAVGLALAIEAAGSGARLTGVNSEACPGMAVSLEKNEAQVVLQGEATLADAIEGGVGAANFEALRKRLHGVRVVAEATIARAVRELALGEHLVAEGAGACGVAALLEGYRPAGPCVVLLSGGNISPAALAAALSRD